MADGWYYAQEDQRMGPVPFDALRDLVAKGQLSSQSLVWNKSLTEWTPVSRMPGLLGPEVPIASLAPVASMAPQVSPSTAPLPQSMQSAPASQLAYASPPQSDDVVVLSSTAVGHILRSQVWIQFVAIVGIIGAILLIASGGLRTVAFLRGLGGMYRFRMSLVVVAGLPPIIAGVLALFLAISLSSYASKIRDAGRMRHPGKFERVMAAQKSFWRLLSLSLIAWFVMLLIIVLALVIF